METHIEEVKSTKRDRGFTLVELLIVIVILGVLATVTVFAVRGITSRGEANACAADKKTLEVAVEAYYAQNGANPASEAALVPDFLKTQSSKYDISGSNVTAQSGSGCTA